MNIPTNVIPLTNNEPQLDRSEVRLLRLLEDTIESNPNLATELLSYVINYKNKMNNRMLAAGKLNSLTPGSFPKTVEEFVLQTRC